MKLSNRTKHFITMLVAAPLLAMLMSCMVAACIMLPFAVLVWPEIMDDEVGL